MSRKKLTIAIISILILIGVWYVTHAQTSSVFGGYITNSVYCTCSNNFLLTFSGPIDGQWVWYPGTPQYDHQSLPRSGVWALGLYDAGGQCLMTSGKGCSPFGNPKGTIGPTVGTSL